MRINVLYKSAPDAFVRDAKGELVSRIPITLDARAGVYFRPQIKSQQILISTVKMEEEDELVPDPDQV